MIGRGAKLDVAQFLRSLDRRPNHSALYGRNEACATHAKRAADKDYIQQGVNGQGDTILVSDISGFGIAAGSSVILGGGEFKILSLVPDGTFEGLGLETISIRPIDGPMDI